MNDYYVYPEIVDAKIPSIAVSIELLALKSIELFDSFINRELELCISRYSSTAIKEINAIVGFDELHRQYGEKSKKIKSAPETLIRGMIKKGSIPRISYLVDLYNIISIKYALALGAHDWDKIKGNIVLKFSMGGETFQPIGATELEPIFPGEYGYFDDKTNELLCRLEARQSNTSKLTETSTKILLIIQGNRKTPKKYLFCAKNELLDNINKFYEFLVIKEYDCAGDSYEYTHPNL